ncbi:MAG: tetratricopeptide repeat protein [Bacteroidia bacterium]
MPFNYRSILLFSFSILLAIAARADGQNRIDSLYKLLSKARDTNEVNLLNQIAWEYRTFNLQLTDSFARLAVEKSQEIAFEKGMGNAYNSMALVERNAGNYKVALEKARWALLHFVRCNWIPGHASSYNTIASIHHIQGNMAVALFYYLKSLKVSESIGDYQGIARSLNNIGSIYMDRNEYEKSLYYLNRAYQIMQEMGDEQAIADELINIANVYLYTGKEEQAVEYYLKSIALNKKGNNKRGVAAGYNNIGTLYADKNNPKEALSYYFQALSINEQIGDIESMILAYNNISASYIKLKMYHSALSYVENALQLAEKHDLKNYIMEAYHLLYQLEVAERNFESALNCHQLYKAYSDTLYNKVTSERINFMEKQYLKEKAEKEQILEGKNTELHAKIHLEKEKQINQYIFTIGLILLIFVIVIYVTFFVLKWQKSEG